MDLIKKLTGKNPNEYEPIAKSLVDNSDVELFKNLVKQDDFLFDFIKENVAKRIQKACNEKNYLNLINFLEFYSPSYETVFAEVLNKYGGKSILSKMQELFLNGTTNQKTYVAKFFSFADNEDIKPLLEQIRTASNSDYEPLAINATELLSKLNDNISKQEAVSKLKSKDEFEQYNGVKFLVNYGAKDCISNIIEVMKNSSFSENIASEIPYLVPLEELIKTDYEESILVICYIINAIPDILSPSAVLDYNIKEIFEYVFSKPLDSTSAVMLMLAKDKFGELISNEEYLFDCDKNTKEEIKNINELLKNINTNKLKSLLYDELYEESNFVFFAVDYADDIEELETLLECSNQTLILKVLTILKEKGMLTSAQKEHALKYITNSDIKNVVLAI